jgi:hypothetical protein
MKEDKLDEFRRIIGKDFFCVFMKLLTEIGPDSRTHRISVIIAGILRFALGKITDDPDKGSLAEALSVIDEEPYSNSAEYYRLNELIDQICQKTGMMNYRVTARGRKYSISENAIAEYCRWYNMPWED